MSDTHFRVSSQYHEKMKEIAIKRGTTIREEYNKAIRDHIKYSEQEIIVMDSELEVYINKRIKKAEDHLASMMGRTGMDTSMTLMGIIRLLDKLLVGVDREKIMLELRKEGAIYFKNAIKSDKENENTKE